MNVALWAAQVTLAVFLAFAGLTKIAQRISQLAGSFLWPDVPAASFAAARVWFLRSDSI